jgi:hypothetical protein
VSTSQDYIKAALRYIGAYQSGDPLAQADAEDSLDAFNDLREAWSADPQNMYGSDQADLQWVGGKSIYSIGNPTCTELGEPPFTGTVTATSGVITSVTNVPADLKVGATLSDTYGGAVIPTGALVTAIGTNTVTFAPVAVGSSVGLDSVTYTVPGDFAIDRPMRITNGLTTISQLDFILEVYETEDRFLEILYKKQPGPWPLVGWYNPTMPYGQLRVYPTPSSSAPCSLYTDTIFARLGLNDNIFLPQGYARAFKWALARELWPQYWGSKPFPQHMAQMLDEAMKTIKAVNARPAPVSRYPSIMVGNDRADVSVILTGG